MAQEREIRHLNISHLPPSGGRSLEPSLPSASVQPAYLFHVRNAQLPISRRDERHPQNTTGRCSAIDRRTTCHVGGTSPIILLSLSAAAAGLSPHLPPAVRKAPSDSGPPANGSGKRSRRSGLAW